MQKEENKLINKKEWGVRSSVIDSVSKQFSVYIISFHHCLRPQLCAMWISRLNRTFSDGVVDVVRVMIPINKHGHWRGMDKRLNQRILKRGYRGQKRNSVKKKAMEERVATSETRCLGWVGSSLAQLIYPEFLPQTLQWGHGLLLSHEMKALMLLLGRKPKDINYTASVKVLKGNSREQQTSHCLSGFSMLRGGTKEYIANRYGILQRTIEESSG